MQNNKKYNQILKSFQRKFNPVIDALKNITKNHNIGGITNKTG